MERDRDRNYDVPYTSSTKATTQTTTSTQTNTTTTSTNTSDQPRKLLPWMKGARATQTATTATTATITPSTTKNTTTSQTPTSNTTNKNPSTLPLTKSITDNVSSSSTQPNNQSIESNKPTTKQSIEKDFSNMREAEGDAIGFNPFASRAKNSFAENETNGSGNNQRSTCNNDNHNNDGVKNDTKPPVGEKLNDKSQSQQQQDKKPPPKQKITLLISDRMGTKIKVNVFSTDTIFKVKQTVGVKLGRRPEKFHLLKAGIKLKDVVSVQDCGLSDGVNLELI